jgi:hypothetical protein
VRVVAGNARHEAGATRQSRVGQFAAWDRNALHEGMPEMCGQQDTAGGVCTAKELHALLLEPRMHSDAGMHADVCGELVEEARVSIMPCRRPMKQGCVAVGTRRV